MVPCPSCKKSGYVSKQSNGQLWCSWCSHSFPALPEGTELGAAFIFKNEHRTDLLPNKETKMSLINCLEKGPADMSVKAMKILSWNPEFIDIFIAYLKATSNSALADAAAENLVNLKNVSLEPLIKALDVKSSSKRICDIIGKIADSIATKPLLKILKNRKCEYREEIIIALGNIGDKTAVRSIIKALRKNNGLLLESCKALAKIGDKRAIPALKSFIFNWDNIPEIGNALKKLGWKPWWYTSKAHLWVATRNIEMLKDRSNMVNFVLMRNISSSNSGKDKIWFSLCALIALGEKGTIDKLKQKLTSSGTVTMAEAYLNCGHPDLHKVAEEWAQIHGYSISSGYGAHPVNWGMWS